MPNNGKTKQEKKTLRISNETQNQPNCHRIGNQNGQALPALAIGMLAMVGLTAAAVDVGRHAFTATELQNLVDAAASAAAKAAGNSGSAYSAAQAIAGLSRVDGQQASFTTGDVVIGKYASGTFTPGGTPSNAVRVTKSATVTNLVAAVLGYPTSTITRSATASIVALGGGIATLPIALGANYWNECITYGCPQPILILVPSTQQDAGWTTFFSNNASSTTISSYIPSPCGGGTVPPFIKIGDDIQLGNGQNQSVFNAIICLVCGQGQNHFLVPVVEEPSHNFNQTQPVVGFATLEVESFDWTSGKSPRKCTDNLNGGQPKAVRIRSVMDSNAPGPPGPGFYGTGYAQVVG